MFWGLIMEPNKRYTQIVEKAFHVSMATLDITTAGDDNVQVMLCYEGRNYLLCNLKKGSHLQTSLDLNFKEGTKIAFTSNGRGHVHLTGYLIPEDDLDDFDEMEDEEEEEDDEEEVPQLIEKHAKRKAQTSPTDNKSLKRLKGQAAAVAEAEEDSSDDDDDDNEDDSDAEAEEPSTEFGEEADSEDEDDEDSDAEEEEETVEDVKPQQKKNKQNKQQQQQQQQKNQKAQNQQNNLSNGKDAKTKQVNKEEQSPNNSQVQKKRVVTGGVQIEDLKVGNGAVAKQGKFVSVYYIGRLKNGKKFDSTTNGDGFKFRLGKGEVIKGWDVGLQGMKIGGKRRITIPPAMAYGAKGSPPTIPSNSTLTFEVELKNVH